MQTSPLSLRSGPWIPPGCFLQLRYGPVLSWIHSCKFGRWGDILVNWQPSGLACVLFHDGGAHSNGRGTVW